MNHHPRIISEKGQPTRLKVWDGERDMSFPVSMGELRNLVSDGMDRSEEHTSELQSLRWPL